MFRNSRPTGPAIKPKAVRMIGPVMVLSSTLPATILNMKAKTAKVARKDGYGLQIAECGFWIGQARVRKSSCKLDVLRSEI